MKFILTNSTVQKNCIDHLLHVPLDGKTVVHFKVNKRTNPQNDTMYMWEKDIADAVGYRMVSEEQKRFFHDNMLVAIYGEKEVVYKCPFTGKITRSKEPAKRTRYFDKKEMSDHLELMQVKAAEMGWVLRDPNFYGYEV